MALAIGGWAAALAACLWVVVARRSLAGRMDLVARACHELRGPITAVRLGLELGRRPGALSPARLHALDLELGRASLALDDLSEIRAGRRPPSEHEPVELRSLLADSLEAWRSTADVHGVSLQLRWGGDQAVVSGSRLRLAQAVGNLIANAIEHGGAVVEVRVAVGEPGPAAMIRVEFVDDGPGLPAPVAELARRGRRSRGSRGHGLAIAIGVAAAHGGRLGAAPSDHGARIVLELPLAVRAASALLTPSA
jgi:signal transduction histidine kinase